MQRLKHLKKNLNKKCSKSNRNRRWQWDKSSWPKSRISSAWLHWIDRKLPFYNSSFLVGHTWLLIIPAVAFLMQGFLKCTLNAFRLKAQSKALLKTMSRALLLSSLVEAGWGHRRQRVWGPVFLFTHVFSLLLCQWNLNSGCLAGLFMKGHQT